MKHVKHKCRTCIHCDIEHLICIRNSIGCTYKYALDAKDLDTEEACDFYEEKARIRHDYRRSIK